MSQVSYSFQGFLAFTTDTPGVDIAFGPSVKEPGNSLLGGTSGRFEGIVASNANASTTISFAIEEPFLSLPGVIEEGDLYWSKDPFTLPNSQEMISVGTSIVLSIMGIDHEINALPFAIANTTNGLAVTGVVNSEGQLIFTFPIIKGKSIESVSIITNDKATEIMITNSDSGYELSEASVFYNVPLYAIDDPVSVTPYGSMTVTANLESPFLGRIFSQFAGTISVTYSPD